MLILDEWNEKQNEFKLMLLFVYETTHTLMENLVQNNIKSIKDIDVDSKGMLVQLFTLIDQSFNWEFTSSKRKSFWALLTRAINFTIK